MIHQTAIVSLHAKIGNDVDIGPYSVIGDNVELGNNVKIMSHVCIDGYTKIGDGTKIFPFATIGYCPQDLKFNGEKSLLVIGERNIIREYVTMHPGTKNGAMETFIGNDNLFMVGVHIAHDCVIGSNIIMGNNATLGGHVTIEDDVIIGGLSAIHQWINVGYGAIIGGMSGVERDVIPYGAVKGERANLYNINIIGLRRAGVDKKEIFALRDAYNTIFFGDGTISENLEKVKQSVHGKSCVDRLVNFMKNDAKRTFCLPKSS